MSFVARLPPLINKRHSYPASPLPCINSDTGNKMVLPRRKNITINCNFKFLNRQLQEENKQSRDDDGVHVHLAPQDRIAQNTIRRHSTIAAPSMRNRRPLEKKKSHYSSNQWRPLTHSVFLR